jgi:hypothetical protein
MRDPAGQGITAAWPERCVPSVPMADALKADALSLHVERGPLAAYDFVCDFINVLAREQQLPTYGDIRWLVDQLEADATLEERWKAGWWVPRA